MWVCESLLRSCVCVGHSTDADAKRVYESLLRSCVCVGMWVSFKVMWVCGSRY